MLYEYPGGIVRDQGARLLEIGGMSDHLHLVLRESKSVTDIQFVKDLKGGSSRWVNETADLPGKFAWQAGYGWFSVGPLRIDRGRATGGLTGMHVDKMSAISIGRPSCFPRFCGGGRIEKRRCLAFRSAN